MHGGVSSCMGGGLACGGGGSRACLCERQHCVTAAADTTTPASSTAAWRSKARKSDSIDGRNIHAKTQRQVMYHHQKSIAPSQSPLIQQAIALLAPPVIQRYYPPSLPFFQH